LTSYLFVAPLARPLSVLHIAEAGYYVDADPGHEGLTLCGQPMARAEIWLPAEPEPADRLCRPCAEAAHMALGDASGLAAEAVQLTLWPEPERPSGARQEPPPPSNLLRGRHA
jgi:hypothetical protein